MIWLQCLAMLLFAGASLFAQAPQGPPPSVAFNCDFPGSDPAHYGILVYSDGRGSYISDGKLARDADPDQASTLEFTLPKATTARVFDLAQKANYFEGKLEAKKKNLASTGDKTLMYKDSTRSTSATYNYSTIPAVQELTTLFQGLSTTLEFGRRLEFDLHYQKLAIDEELKRMEDMSVQSGAAEYAAIAPTLQKIVNDQSVVNAARARAQRMLDSAASGK